MMSRLFSIAAIIAAAAFQSYAGRPPEIVVSVADQELAYLAWGKVVVHVGDHVRISDKPLATFLPPEEPSLLARAD